MQAQGTDGKKLAPPPPAMPQPVNPTDTAGVTKWKVRPTVPMNFNQLMDAPPVVDLKNPSNITTVAEFDPVTGNYIIHTRLGDTDLVTPFMLTKKQYEDWQLKRSMEQYYRHRNAELAKDDRNKEPFNIFDMNFSLGPLEKIFGPGGVKLKTTGSVQLTMG
ncbi:MAG: hypothetical protein K2M97_03580, partial [Muribaculaceae bacterium]|nr:hypothetical protein [Muribaculaceae bacterium]